MGASEASVPGRPDSDRREEGFMDSPETDGPLGWLAEWGWLVDWLATAILLFVAVGAMGVAFLYLFGPGIHHMLDDYPYWYWTFDPETGQYSHSLLLVHIDFVVIPLAAIAAAWLRWGADWITAPLAPRAIRARSRWGEEGTPPPGESPARPLFPLLGAAVLCAVFWYWGWWALNPHHLFGIHPLFGVQRWISVALMAGVGYAGMILFPRLTAWMGGAVAGPAFFALAGYTLFPSSMRDPEGRLIDMLANVFLWGSLAVAIAAILTMILSKRLRRHPLSYALWMGAFMLCVAVFGTFNGIDGTT